MNPKLLFIAVGLSATLFSCKNKKAAIVERQKFLKHQIDSIKKALAIKHAKEDEAETNLLHEKLDSLHNSPGFREKLDVEKEIARNQVHRLYFPRERIAANVERQVKDEEVLYPLMDEWDSLEVELKKY